MFSLDILNKFRDICDAHPSPLRIWLGNRLFIAVYEPEQVKVRQTNILQNLEYFLITIYYLTFGVFKNILKTRNKLLHSNVGRLISKSQKKYKSVFLSFECFFIQHYFYWNRT